MSHYAHPDALVAPARSRSAVPERDVTPPEKPATGPGERTRAGGSGRPPAPGARGGRDTEPTEVRRRERPSGDADDGSGDRRDDRPRVKRRRVRARKVRRIVRHIEPWSVLKISLLFYLAVFLIVVVAGTLLWNLARETGVIESVEAAVSDYGAFGVCVPVDGADSEPAEEPDAAAPQFDEQTGLDDPDTDDEAAVGTVQRDEDGCLPDEEFVGEFRFVGERIFQGVALGGLVLVLAGAAFNVVLVILFNLISDLTGGLRVTVLEEEPPDRGPPDRRGGQRQGRPPADPEPPSERGLWPPGQRPRKPPEGSRERLAGPGRQP